MDQVVNGDVSCRLFMASLVHLSRYDLLLLAMGFGAGIGIGCAALPAAAIQSHYWNKRRPLAIGIVMAGTYHPFLSAFKFLTLNLSFPSFAGSPIGGIVYPLMLNHLIHGRVGYVWAIRIVAFILLAVLLVGCALMVPRPPKLERGKRPPVLQLLKDQTYMLMIAGCVDLFFFVCDETGFTERDIFRLFFVFMTYSFSGASQLR